MRYRIKIITYKTGRKEYYPAFKTWWGWTGLSLKGTTGFDYDYDSREESLKCIDKHFIGNATKQSIEFEYINK